MPTSYVNRKASFNYELLERFEAGICLQGSEVKSFRAGGVDFRDAFAILSAGNIELEGLYIPIYDKSSYNNHEPRRKRRLLLNGHEIQKLRKGLEQKGLTLVPTKMYFKGRHIKIEIALGRGKKLYDKRKSDAEKNLRRELKDLR